MGRDIEWVQDKIPVSLTMKFIFTQTHRCLKLSHFFGYKKISWQLFLTLHLPLILLVEWPKSAIAQDDTNVDKDIQSITISTTAINASKALQPTKTLRGDELRNKLSTSLGETLNSELGLSASGFGAAASRPIVRGMDGARVQVLENGMAMGDVSVLSMDHAVANGLSHTKEVEILRGAAALMYGSGTSAGVINIVNDKILTELPNTLSASIDSKISSADHGQSNGIELSTGLGPLAFHFDASKNTAQNYLIPGYRELGGPKSNWSSKGNTLSKNILPNSYANSDTLGAGVSYISSKGYTGVSIEQFNHLYGIPSFDGSQISQHQDKFDLQHLSTHPMIGIDSIKFKFSSNQYKHTELSNTAIPQSRFNNDGYTARIEVAHQPFDQFIGVFGLEHSKGSLSAYDLLSTSRLAILPTTSNSSIAAFWIEEKRWQSLSADVGIRLEKISKKPSASTPYSDPLGSISAEQPIAQDKAFNLLSWSSGLTYRNSIDQQLGINYSVTQRAPATEELFSFGAHDATATFDIGKVNLVPETAHNLEISMRSTNGPVQWKTNIFYNKIDHFIYASQTGQQDPQSGFDIRQFNQASVTQKGIEAEITYHWNQEGSSYRVYADHSQTQFVNGQYTPLQAPVRLGLEWRLKQGPFKSGFSLKHAFKQTHLASSELAQTPAYTDLSAVLSYHQGFKNSDVDWYMIAKNLLNQDIRYSTTVETLRLYAPQAARSLSVGVKWNF